MQDLSPKLDLINKENKTTILLGDFNINLSDYTQDVDVNHFMDILSLYSFFPTINLPTRITDHSETLIHTLPVSAAHVQSSNNRFCRYYVIFGRNNRSALVDKIPVFRRKY